MLGYGGLEGEGRSVVELYPDLILLDQSGTVELVPEAGQQMMGVWEMMPSVVEPQPPWETKVQTSFEARMTF